MEIVQINLRDSNETAWYKLNNLKVKTTDCVIMESERGTDYGRVNTEPIQHESIEGEIRSVLRLATKDDLKQIEDNRSKAKDAFNTCLEKIESHKLNMKLVSCEYSF
ncbi:MAG: PSP1 domain-containing protein, partial [Candidatus Omnitrophica bacterium]|nr:PSP1 domain-containing protein [Candidatus Omnitrophota bacterium]